MWGLRGLEAIALAVGRGLEERRGSLLLAAVLFAMGILFGALAVGALGERDRQELVGAAEALFRTLRNSGAPTSPGQAFARSLGVQLKSLALFWALGITAVGSLAVLALTFLRGFAAGFAAGFLGAELGGRGMLYAAAALLPHNLLAVPGMLLAAAGAIQFTVLLLRGHIRQTRAVFYRELGRYSAWMLGVLAVLVAASFVEAYVTPLFMRLAARV